MKNNNSNDSDLLCKAYNNFVGEECVKSRNLNSEVEQEYCNDEICNEVCNKPYDEACDEAYCENDCKAISECEN